jgi:hypothetical protein
MQWRSDNRHVHNSRGVAIAVRCRMLTVSSKVINNLLCFMGTFVETSLLKQWPVRTGTDEKRHGDDGLNK